MLLPFVKIYKKRKKWSRKGDFGRLLIISGSEELTGSPRLCALAAYRSGCDLVFLTATRRAADLAARNPNLITYPLSGKFLAVKHVKEILAYVEKVKPSSVVIGPALGRKKETFAAVQQLVALLEIPMVIDADGIRAVALKKSVLKGKKVVLTPHAGEFMALIGEKVSNNLNQRKQVVKKAARELGAVILLKGHVDVISNGEKVVTNKTGSVYMTKGGFGDTLAGICGAFLARGFAPFKAARAAAFVNGKAGELAARQRKESLLATDANVFISKVVKNL